VALKLTFIIQIYSHNLQGQVYGFYIAAVAVYKSGILSHHIISVKKCAYLWNYS